MSERVESPENDYPELEELRDLGVPEDVLKPFIDWIDGKANHKTARIIEVQQPAEKCLLTALDNLPSRIHAERTRQGLSLRAAAREMGVAFNSLTRLEQGGNATLANVRAALSWLTADL